LELENDNGQEAAWFLDDRFMYLTNDVDQLPRGVRQTITRVVRDVLRVIWQELVISENPVLPPDILWINDLGRAARRTLIADFDGDLYPRSDVLLLEDRLSGAAVAPIWSVLDRARTAQLLGTSLLTEHVAAMETGLLRMTSPVDGLPLHTDISYILTASVVAHRFFDRNHGLTFYVVSGLWRGEVFALYLPALAHTIYRDRRSLGHSDGFLGTQIHTALARHIFDYGHLLESYVKAPSRKPCVKYHQDHLGHHLWNELAGLDRMVKCVSASKLPNIYILGASHSEMYGPVDQLFPELGGRVNRISTDLRAFIEMSYKSRQHVLLVCGQYVSRNLAQRIIDRSELGEELKAARRQYDSLSAKGFSIVMFGLRVENRTIVDIGDFVAYVVELLQRELGKVAVVIDGHNSVGANSDKLYASYAERLANKAPVEVEREIVDKLSARFGDDRSVVIISTIGAPMSESIHWCNRSDFFITPWGAGLAKYRWVCNRPGLVLASPRFLREAGEQTVHLYDSPEFMEDPSRLEFVASTDVQDEPDAEVLVSVETHGRMNFSVNRDAFAVRLRKFIDDTGVRKHHTDAHPIIL
jgi:hypothetical protein